MPDESPKPFFNISDLVGIKEALMKLIETVSAGGGRVADGVSRLANAYLLASKDTRNEVENIRLVEGAKNQMLAERLQMLTAISSGSQPQLKSLGVAGVEVSAHFAEIPVDIVALQERANNRVAYQNALHQVNLDSVVATAATVLTEEPAVTDKPVDQDWINRFFESAKLVSSEELQVLWGNILAGEIKQPGAYSLRTLEVMRNLTQREAHLFRTAANFAIKIGQECMIGLARYGHGEMVSSSYGFGYNNVSELIDCGLVSPNDYNIHLKAGPPGPEQQKGLSWSNSFKIGNQVLVISGDESLDTHYSVHAYTKAGNELYHLTADGAKLSIPFLVAFTKSMRDTGMQTQYAEVTGQLQDGSFTYNKPLIALIDEVL